MASTMMQLMRGDHDDVLAAAVSSGEKAMCKTLQKQYRLLLNEVRLEGLWQSSQRGQGADVDRTDFKPLYVWSKRAKSQTKPPKTILNPKPSNPKNLHLNPLSPASTTSERILLPSDYLKIRTLMTRTETLNYSEA